VRCDLKGKHYCPALALVHISSEKRYGCEREEKLILKIMRAYEFKKKNDVHG